MASNRRRLAQDQGALLSAPPPDYFFHPEYSGDNLSSVSVYLAGPIATPFESGVFHLSLRIPATYPAEPPKANFHTKIFHPNVDERTGDVCVDALKRDWKPELTLKDILITIRCLLVYPNPTSSLNEAAGKLLLDDYDGFARHARLMTEVHAPVSDELRACVDETRKRDAENDDVAAPAPSAAKPENEKKSKAPQPEKTQTLKHHSGKQILRQQPSTRGTPVPARKIKRAVSPTMKVARASSADSEGSDSGKENVQSNVIRPPTPTKRSREQSFNERDAESHSDAGPGSPSASGRKSPKYWDGQDAVTKQPLQKSPKKHAPKTTKTKKKSTAKIGLKRF